MCTQTVGLIQKSCEENGIVSSTISIIDELNIILKVYRYLSVPFDLGYPLGDPTDHKEQKKIVKNLLNLIVT